MIFPILGGLLHWRMAPVTWTIVLFNFVVLVFSSHMGRESQEGLENTMKADYFLNAQGRIYAQYVNQSSSAVHPSFLRGLAKQVAQGQIDRLQMLGQLAFRDVDFIASADTIQYEGDQVAFKHWKKKLVELKSYQNDHPSFALGLNAEDISFTRWVTYIFVHSGLFHFMGNMLFLIIFGAALEMMIGGLGLLVVFLLSGVFAAGVFAVMTGVTSSPLVGASGAVSGVMALYCALNWGRPIRFFYWLFLPFRGFMGFVYMPAWVGLVLWVISDLSGYFGALPELGGVAHTAHLGGELAGAIVALLLMGLRRIWPVQMLHNPAPPKVAMWTLIPFLAPLSKSSWPAQMKQDLAS